MGGQGVADLGVRAAALHAEELADVAVAVGDVVAARGVEARSRAAGGSRSPRRAGTPKCAPAGMRHRVHRARATIGDRQVRRDQHVAARVLVLRASPPRARGCRGSSAAPAASARPGAGSSPSRRSPRSRGSSRPSRWPRRSAGGSVRVASGSRIASRGNSGKSAISSLTLRLVVLDHRGHRHLAAGAGGGGDAGQRRDLERPAHAVVLARHAGRSPPARAALPPWVKTASATLAVSITEPPPTARNESAPASLAAAAQRSTTSVDESCGHVVEHAGHLEAAVLDARLAPGRRGRCRG